MLSGESPGLVSCLVIARKQHAGHSAMRHRHLIQKIGGCSYPSSFICLDVDSVAVTAPNSPGRVIETLTGWTGIGVSGVGGVYGKEKMASGTDAASLWQSLASRCRRGGIIWVFSERAGNVWTLLGLWERIEDGQCRIVGGEPRKQYDVPLPTVQDGKDMDRRSQHNAVNAGDTLPSMRIGADRAESTPSATVASGKAVRSAGCCILEDPPTVIDVRISGLPGRLRIVDTANYGLAPSVIGNCAASRAGRAFRFVLGMIGTLKAEGLGSLKATVASQAMSSWKTRHFKHPVLVHDNSKAELLEEDCYYGGRCEASHIGRIDERVYHLDVSSMYTSICASAMLPSCLAGYSDAPTECDINSLLQTHATFASVTVATDEPSYPYHDRRLGLTIWPVGTFTTSLAGPELEDALVRGHIRKWHRIAWYERSPFLASFGCHMLALRERFKDDADLRQWCKAMGVSVVGKLGQRARYWEDEKTAVFHGPWDTWYTSDGKGGAKRWRAVAGFTQSENIAGFAYDAVPAAASWVTSLARLKLLNLIRRAGINHIQYCDTDSLMVSEPGFDSLSSAGLIGGGVAGELRLVSCTTGVVINGIKDYVENGKHVQAGRPMDAGPGEPDKDRVWITPRLKGACYSRRKPEPIRLSVPFEHRAYYRHGVVLPDGSVCPHVLNEG